MRNILMAATLIALPLSAIAQVAPDVNSAHRGGGVILEGPPGYPAPPVVQTPSIGGGTVVQVLPNDPAPLPPLVAAPQAVIVAPGPVTVLPAPVPPIKQ
jgi:hypothetical protein